MGAGLPAIAVSHVLPLSQHRYLHIRCCGDGFYWFRPYGGSLLIERKSKQNALAGMTHPHGLHISSRT